MLRAMSVVIEMSLEHFDEFMNKCDPARPEYETLKYGVVLRRPKEDHFERVIEIRCNLAQAKVFSVSHLRSVAPLFRPSKKVYISRASCRSIIQTQPKLFLPLRSSCLCCIGRTRSSSDRVAMRSIRQTSIRTNGRTTFAQTDRSFIQRMEPYRDEIKHIAISLPAPEANSRSHPMFEFVILAVRIRRSVERFR
jgi:hypothetical protein